MSERTDLIPHIIKHGDGYHIGMVSPVAPTPLPAMVFRPRITKDGLFLAKDRNRFDVPHILYGVKYPKISKIIMDDYARTKKSLGVLLTGAKGMGKSLLSEVLGNEMIDKGFPVLYITEELPASAISEFIKVLGPCCVILEEFDKIYNWDKTPAFIPLFSDTSNDGTLFIITANHISSGTLDPLLDRPQRLKYRINFGEMTEDVINHIVDDNVGKEELRILFKTWAKDNRSNIDSLLTLVKMSNHIENEEELVEYIGMLNIPTLSSARPTLDKITGELKVDIEERLTFQLSIIDPFENIKVLVYKENEFNHELLHRETIDITCYKTGTEHTIVCPTPYGDLEIKLGSSYQRTGGAFKWTCVVNPHSKIGYPLTFGPQVVVDRNLPWAGTMDRELFN